jgi:hypothetical protein
MNRREFIAALGGAVVWLLAAGATGEVVGAEDWPGHLITMVVPYAATLIGPAHGSSMCTRSSPTIPVTS